MIRLSTIKGFGLTADPTWDNIPVTFWTTMEITTAVLCTCLPSIRAGLLRVFPTIFGSATYTSTVTSRRKWEDIADIPLSSLKYWLSRKSTSMSS